MKLTIGRVDLSGLGIGVARLLEGLSHHQHPYQSLHGPAVPNEPVGEVVEQFGVRGLVTQVAKVIGRFDNSGSKHRMPDAIHEDTGRERVLRTGNQVGHLHPPTAGGAGTIPFARQSSDIAARHRITKVCVDTANVEPTILAGVEVCPAQLVERWAKSVLEKVRVGVREESLSFDIVAYRLDDSSSYLWDKALRR